MKEKIKQLVKAKQSNAKSSCFTGCPLDLEMKQWILISWLTWLFMALDERSQHIWMEDPWPIIIVGWLVVLVVYCSWASLQGSLPVLSAHSLASNWQMPFLNQRKGENGCRNFFMTKCLPDLRIEPATVRIPGGRASIELPCPAIIIISTVDIKACLCCNKQVRLQRFWGANLK